MGEANVFEGVIVEPKIVMMDLDASSDQEALDKLARKLLEAGYVKESYVQAVKNREKVFSTGLAFEGMGVALPHTDSIHVNQQAIAIAILKNPVTFIEMGTESDKVEVKLLFMLAIEKPESQIDFLSKMMDMFQDKERLISIRNSSTPEEVVELFEKYLAN